MEQGGGGGDGGAAQGNECQGPTAFKGACLVPGNTHGSRLDCWAYCYQ